MTQLTTKAKSLGMTPQGYVRVLINGDLALDRKARTTTFTELMGPGRAVNEQELDRLIDEVRARRHSARGAK